MTSRYIVEKRLLGGFIVVDTHKKGHQNERIVKQFNWEDSAYVHAEVENFLFETRKLRIGKSLIGACIVISPILILVGVVSFILPMLGIASKASLPQLVMLMISGFIIIFYFLLSSAYNDQKRDKELEVELREKE